MGITGLLPLLSSVSSPTNISHFNGCTAAIDVYSWLHKGIVCCAEQLFNGEETDQYIQYVINRTEIVINAGVKPILVFDGQNLPAKKMTEQQRQSLVFNIYIHSIKSNIIIYLETEIRYENELNYL